MTDVGGKRGRVTDHLHPRRGLLRWQGPAASGVPRPTAYLLRRDEQGRVQAPAGLLSPHRTVRQGARTGRFDDAVGFGFTVVDADRALCRPISRLDCGV